MHARLGTLLPIILNDWTWSRSSARNLSLLVVNISHSDYMRWHLSSMNVIQRMQHMVLYKETCRTRRNKRTGLNTLRPKQNGRHFADDDFKRIFLNENIRISIKISLKFVPKGTINNIPALVQIMAWRRTGDKPLSGPVMVTSPTQICVTRPLWVKAFLPMPRTPRNNCS